MELFTCHLFPYRWQRVSAGLLLLLAALAARPVCASQEGCDPVPIASDSVQHVLDEVSTGGIYELTLDAGMWLIAASTPAESAVEPVVQILEPGCAALSGESEGFAYVYRTASWVVAEVLTPATYLVSVSAQDPRQPLGAHRLESAFSAQRSIPDEQRSPAQDPPEVCSAPSTPLSNQAFTADWLVSLRQDIDEVDCDVLGGDLPLAGAVTVTATGAPLVASLFGDQQCDSSSAVAVGVALTDGGRLSAAVFPGAFSLALDPDGGAAGAYELYFEYFKLCRLAAGDDFGDHPLCAVALIAGEERPGRIEGAWEDDQDFFTFSLAKQAAIELHLAADFAASLSLYHADGRRLALGPGIETAKELSWSEVLPAGRYFVRVTGAHGGEGDYLLRLITTTVP
jgi:hypothetical protein